jgi:DNA-binding transcriptional LysR family regulator
VLDWDDLRFFLALTRHGTLSAAAKDLNVAQSTVGRRLRSLEGNLGVRLLNRTPEGYILTLAGRDVREKVERLEAEALTLEFKVSGRDTRLTGLVRLSCPESIGLSILASRLAALHSSYPDLMVEILPNPPELSLSRREAEVSISLRQPEQHDLVVRRIGTMAFGLYASHAYLRRHGNSDLLEGFSGHHVVAQLADVQNIDQTDWLTVQASQARVAIRTNSHETAVQATVHGAGLSCLARFRADHEDSLVRLTPPGPIPKAGIWLVVHKDNRSTPRIRVVLTQITDTIRKLNGQLDPDD